MGESAAVKSIGALSRGLAVMHAVEESSALTLAELHLRTGIPKASLLRILKTLIESGWVIRHELERRYAPAAAPGNSGAAAQWRARLSALAAPVRVTLEKRVPWPTDLAVRDGSTMLILDAHRPINSLAVNYRVLGFRPAMLVSSLGRCYLAFALRKNGVRSWPRCPENLMHRIGRPCARMPCSAWWLQGDHVAIARAIHPSSVLIRPSVLAPSRCRSLRGIGCWPRSAAPGCPG